MTTTLATQLKTTIERWAEELRRTSGLAALARQGKLPPRAVALYLESLRYLLHNSQLNLVVASAASEKLGDLELAGYFARKAHEEIGHEHWAIDDLNRLPEAATAGLRPSAGMLSLVEWQRNLIERHPVCFAAYALWAEYFTVLVGDEWLDGLAASGFERGQISSITKHLQTDRAHAAHGFAEIDQLWQGQPEAAVIIEAVERAGQIFERFCDEICGEAARAA
jgi:hypothetical protein